MSRRDVHASSLPFPPRSSSSVVAQLAQPERPHRIERVELPVQRVAAVFPPRAVCSDRRTRRCRTRRARHRRGRRWRFVQRRCRDRSERGRSSPTNLWPQGRSDGPHRRRCRPWLRSRTFRSRCRAGTARFPGRLKGVAPAVFPRPVLALNTVVPSTIESCTLTHTTA